MSQASGSGGLQHSSKIQNYRRKHLNCHRTQAVCRHRQKFSGVSRGGRLARSPRSLKWAAEEWDSGENEVPGPQQCGTFDIAIEGQRPAASCSAQHKTVNINDIKRIHRRACGSWNQKVTTTVESNDRSPDKAASA